MLGLRLRWLGTEHLTWSDLLAIVRQSRRGTALFRAVAGEDGEWDLQNHLLAGVFDLLAAANWQRGGDESAKKPERLHRPGVVKQAEGEVMARGKAVSIDEMNARLGWPAPA
ncbi:hypothetical protein [Arthrobacter sp. PsM3]|uniref:hypothetical protein n=1 Tax=Arthrobacter sp. PsM3 TaxID=3030531 RepID=UPI00263B2AFC|nr:hypothetical protein [Arthrobacter sp. PsM3]MDN4645357.1 hypothetical protein [Arthrobacter sp. PsM3]